MACRLAGHYLTQCRNIANWNPGNKLQWNLNQNLHIFIQENAYENVIWKMAATLSRPQCVKVLIPVGFCLSITLSMDLIIMAYISYNTAPSIHTIHRILSISFTLRCIFIKTLCMWYHEWSCCVFALFSVIIHSYLNSISIISCNFVTV